ncbi:MAG TPA: exodeoxyribonuclease VII small subunit [Patescibacteria group bacterium]|nr:exodeoxyribonuclease VII small subunit [Patescibacteria group bacterium]
MSPKNNLYKELRNELDKVISKLQSDTIDIDEVLILYKKGQKLIKELEDYIKKAENTIKEIKNNIKKG